MKTFQTLTIALFGAVAASCNSGVQKVAETPVKPVVIFDTDANNELDDQHALAYLLFNGQSFTVQGVTVNATKSGGNIEEQYAEAKRVMDLATVSNVPLLKGANGSFQEIRSHVNDSVFDGMEAVQFIIDQVNRNQNKTTILLAVGKLTNIALALEKEPSIASKTRLVWLGSNYPEPGEYNQDNDTVAMNYLLNKNIPFEMVTVRYGKPSGTSAVSVTQREIGEKMPGLGPKAAQPVTGRHGGTFTNFGDYSVSLFEHIYYNDESKSRALFDMVAVAILKNASWGEQKEIPAPVLINNAWVERPSNSRKIIVWENFDKNAILSDFFQVMKAPELAEQE